MNGFSIYRSIFFSTVTLVIVEVAVVLYIMISANNDYQLSKLVILEQQLECVSCFDCIKNECEKEKFKKCQEMSQICRRNGWNFDWSSAVSLKCMKDKFFVDTVAKEIKHQYRDSAERFNKNLRIYEKDNLETALQAFSDPPRIIFHWFPHCWNREARSGWTTLSDYERDSSTYTISTGPPGSCDKDTFIVVPETGLYNIYGKLTFACEQADQKPKRVLLEVAMIGNDENELPTILLRDEDRNTCWTKGDLSTLYQAGLFRLMKGNKIFLKYETPSGVKLSSSRGSPFKSSLGAYRVGLS